MGAFLSAIKNKKISIDKELLNISGSKIRQYFCSYRSICENFSISIPQYMQIFGSNVKSFNVWDPQRYGYINAMQIFSGIFIFSKMAFEDKIKFLYEFFDLNQEGYLQYDDLAFMFISVCQATCKVYELKTQIEIEQIIQKYLDQFFSQETQLKYEDFIRWSYRNEEIIQYFQTIGYPFKPQTNKHMIDEYDENNLISHRSDFSKAFATKKQIKSKVNIDNRFLNILKNDHILLQELQKHEEFNPMMKWVYGIRVNDIRYPLYYHKSQYYKAANQKFMYICGKNIVVLYPKLNIQKNYTGHCNPVSCIEVASCGSLVASGELGHNPDIHIWSLKSGKCISKFTKIHKHSIKILKFMKNNELLISVSDKESSSIIILNVASKQIVLSTYMPGPALNIIHFGQAPINQFYILLPSKMVKCSSTDGVGYEISYNKLSAFEERKGEPQKLKSACVLKLAQEFVIMVISQSNQIAIYNPKTKSSDLVDNGDVQRSLKRNIGTNRQIKINHSNRDEKVIDIFPSTVSNRIYFLFRKCFKVYQIQDFSMRCIADVKSIPKQLYNLEFVQLIEVDENCVILISLMGDTIKVTNFINTNRTKSQKQQFKSLKFTENVIEVVAKAYKKQEQLLSNQSHSDHSIQEYQQNEENSICFQKYYQIFKMQKITGVCFLSKQNYDLNSQTQKQLLAVASNSMIYLIDQIEKQLVSLQCLDQKITHIHSFGNTYAVATQLKYIFIIRNGVTLEKAKCSDNSISSLSLVNGLKLTADSLIIAIDQFIQVYFKSAGSYLSKEPKKIKLEHGIPIHISMTSIPKVFLIVTKESREKSILKLSAEPKQKNPVLTAKQLNCDFLQTFYPEVNGMKSPILFSGIKGMFLMAQPNGDIQYWSSLNHIITNQQSYSLLSGHCSPISELIFSSRGFISAGSDDGQVIIWDNSKLLSQSEINEQEDQIIMPEKTKHKNKSNEQQQFNKSREQNLKVVSNIYMEQLKSLCKFNCEKMPLKDSQIEVLVRGGEIYKDIVKNINSILIPNNLQLFQPLAEKKKVSVVQLDKKNSKKFTKQQANYTLNFKCSFVYGFSSQQTRQSLFYVHQYSDMKNNQIYKLGVNSNGFEKGKRNKSGAIQYIKQQLLPLNDLHTNCKRSFFYFTGRIGVIWSPVTKTQMQYDFHINRITCSTVHPSKQYVCTAESQNANALIHIWSTDNLALLRSYKTRHIKFISKMEFSRNGNFLVSLGGPLYHQSIQIHNLICEQSICFKYVEDTCFYDIKYNPYKCDEVAVCGYKSLWVMRISNRTLIKMQQAKLSPGEQLTCIAYTSSVYGSSIESDIIAGNSAGDLSLFICGQYVVCKKSAHDKSINCIKLCQLFGYRTIMITAAEDNLIKLWDTKFNQISRINIKQILLSPKVTVDYNKISVAPQSLDVYHCFSNTDSKNHLIQKVQNQKESSYTSQTLLLVGTRSGSIIQIKISNQYQGIRQYCSKSNLEQNKSSIYNLIKKTNESETIGIKEQNNHKITQKVQLNSIVHFSNFPSTFHSSVRFDIKGNLMVTYFKANLNLIIWNLQKRQMMKLHKLSYHPSVVKFTKTNLLCVGYLDGRIEFFQISNGFSLTPREEKLFYDTDYQPIQIICSQNDLKLAIVFTKIIHQKRISNNGALSRQETIPFEGYQLIIVYQKVLNNNMSQNFVISDKNIHKIQDEKRKYKDVFWCDFNAEGNKLLICYTPHDYCTFNNSNRRRVMSSYQNIQSQSLYQYVVYDITKKNQKQLNNQQFNTLNFAPAIKAKYHYYAQCTVIQDSSIKQNKNYENDKLCFEIERKGKSHIRDSNKKAANTQSSNLNNFSQLDQITSGSNLTNTNSIGTQLKGQYVPICQMAQYQKFTIMGTIYGQILAVRSSLFYSQISQQNLETQIKSVKVKCFACLDSPITNMQVRDNRLYVSSKQCSTIMQYEMMIEQASGKLALISQQKKANEKTYKNENQSHFQKYYEIYTPQKIENWLKYVFPKRKNFYELKLNCQQKKQYRDAMISKQENKDEQELVMEPYHIIGRNAYYKRSNVVIDLKDNLITFSGCNLLIMTAVENKNQYHQQFLKLDNTVFSVNPQISTITLSTDKRTLYAGTTEENCQVIIWDISTRTQLQHICLKDFVSVLLIKVSEFQRYAVVLAINKQAKSTIFFLSLTAHEILATFCVHQQAQICDIQFVPNNQFKFLACGSNYMAEWALKGGLLFCQRYNMRNPKDFIDLNQQSTTKAPVIFYSIIFLKDIAITGGSDGYLYMWNDRNLIKKQNANPKSAILSLFASKNSKIFASGAVDGKAIVWQLGASSIIQKVYQFNIYSGKQNIIPSKYHIQSVNIGKNQIFIGTRSGQIHKFDFTPGQNGYNEESHNNNKQKYHSILSAYDNDRINSCSFNISSQKLYILTQSGIFSVFNLLNNEKIKEEKIKIDNQQIVKMLACKLSSKIYIVMKKGIDVYTYVEDGKNSNKFSKSKDFFNTSNSQIKTAILSLNEKYLALLMSPNHLENAKIEIYNLCQQDGREFYVQHKVLQNIPANIQIIDFSTDNGYLVYKNSEQDETIIDLTTKEVINTNMIQFELEWNQQAKKTSKFIRDICSTYSDENKLRCILQIMNHSVLATDQMGSVRLFRYNQNTEENTVEYYQIYLEHLNGVYLCIISSDCSILVTVGSQDKSIIIWKIKNFDMLTSKKQFFEKKSQTNGQKILAISENI